MLFQENLSFYTKKIEFQDFMSLKMWGKCDLKDEKSEVE